MTSTPWTSRCSPRPGFPLYSEAISFPSPRGEVGTLGAPSPSPKQWGTGPAPVLPPPLPRLPLHLGEERAVRAPALATGGQPQGHGVVLSSLLRDRTQPSKQLPALFGRLTVVAGDPEQRDAAQAKQPGSPSVTRTRAHHPPLARTLIHPEGGQCPLLRPPRAPAGCREGRGRGLDWPREPRTRRRNSGRRPGRMLPLAHHPPHSQPALLGRPCCPVGPSGPGIPDAKT